MEFKFGKKPANGTDPSPEEQGHQDKGRQTMLLVVLLLLLGVVGYLYFFTSLIRPQEPPPKPPAPPQVVKQPLPAKGETAPADTAKPAAPAPPAPVAAAKPATPPAQPVPAAPAKPAAPPAAKPAPVQPPAPAAKPAAPPAASPAKPTAPPAKPAQPAPVAAAKASPAPAAAKPAPAQPPVKKEATAKPAPPAKPVAKKTGPWTLVVGFYVVEGTLAEDMAKLKKAGLTPVMTMGPKRPATMHRLLYGSYDDKAEAVKAVEQLKRQAGDGFTVPRGGKHEVYAGSYAQLSGAQSEQQRLAAAGLKVTIQKASVPVSSRKLTAGTFTDRAAAEAALKKVKSLVSGTPVLE